MDGQILYPVIPFNLVYDTDYGILRYIRDTCKDAPNYNWGVLNMHKIFLIQLLSNRDDVNPVKLVIEDDELLDCADDIYNDIMEEDYRSVLLRSIPTAIYDYVSMLSSTEGIVKPNILCQRDEEVEFIKKNFEPFKKGKCEILTGKVDANKYDPLFTKVISDMPNMYYNVGCNTIYLARYWFNVEIDEDGKEIPKMNDEILLFEKNQCMIVNMHKSEYMNPEQFL